MVDVSVRQNHCVELVDWDGKRFVFFCRLGAPALEHSAVERDGMTVHMQQVARARHFAGRAYKRNFQVLPLGYSASLKENRKSLLVLRHERWLPPTTTSLIEKISERVFILTCMLRELDHDGLV